MSRTLQANVFSVSSLMQLKKDLRKYKNSLSKKTKIFVEKLLKVGIETAREHINEDGRYGTHKMADLGNVFFRQEINTEDGKVYGIMFGHGDEVHGEWYENDGSGQYHLVEDTINSMLAIEFGTAARALPVQEAFGVTAGQGQKAKFHADENAWYIITELDGKGKPSAWQLATAITPSRPMYHAGLEMYNKVKDIGKEVFGS